MQKRIQEIVATFQLEAHPEGGWFKELYRSVETTHTPQGTRNLLTSIYFLLTSDNASNFHKIESDEIWYYHEGSSLTVHTLSEAGEYKALKVGNNLSAGEQPQVLVPKGLIFGSTVSEENSYSFVSCAVAPGFDFQDFKLYSEEDLLARYPEHAEIIKRLTP
ncbi:cupin domain-containing protein [Lishizhenia sp.]|uniref:cupin domain-containing protein n=1 Tax=Lishizhenia sp. TaxID=2497594 RepID=UPI00299D6674|nr:cupin domain-containing protein [Lishizhenia sp.]MDX1444680.1 cupin domain-containing protein [Lishizhenia sp.]